MTWYLNFLYNSLLTSLLCISVLLCPIKRKLVCHLDMPLVVNLCLNFINIIELMMSLFKSSSSCPYLKFYWTYKLHTSVPGTNKQQHKVHLMSIVKVTLTNAERSQVEVKRTNDHILQAISLGDIPVTKVHSHLIALAFLTL